LILAGSGTTLASVMQPEPVAAHTAMDQEEVAALFSKYDLVRSRSSMQPAASWAASPSMTWSTSWRRRRRRIFIAWRLGHEASVHESTLDSVRRRLPWLVINLGRACSRRA